MACRGLKQYEPSKKYFDLSIKYFSDSYGEDNYNVGLVLNSIVKLNWMTENWEEAQIKLNKALVIYKRVLGEYHPNIQNTQRYLLAVKEKITFQEYEKNMKIQEKTNMICKYRFLLFLKFSLVFTNSDFARECPSSDALFSYRYFLKAD